jgi:hypothetical protein
VTKTIDVKTTRKSSTSSPPPGPFALLPEPITDPGRPAHLNVYRRDRLGGISMSTIIPPDLPGQHFRQVQRWPAA